MAYLPKLHTAEDDRRFITGVVQRCETTVFEQDRQVVGFAVLDGDRLEHLYVLGHAQNRGVGAALLGDVQRRRPAGFDLWVFQQNSGARRFYERHGLVVVEETDGSG